MGLRFIQMVESVIAEATDDPAVVELLRGRLRQREVWSIAAGMWFNREYATAKRLLRQELVDMGVMDDGKADVPGKEGASNP